MDKLYIGDIPTDYHYARYNPNYIDLYNTNYIPPNTNFDYYRVYLYDNLFIYDHYNSTTGSSGSNITSTIDVTNDWYYRRDMPSIMFMSVVYVCILVILFNIVSSVFKKGGLLSGLL